MLNVEDLTKTFESGARSGNVAVRAVDGISLVVEQGEFFTLLGPSGCGKSTTLRCVAGLERPTGGRIVLRDQVLYSKRDGTNVPVSLRGLGMVFQSYAIWPHMTVAKNVAFPLTVARKPQRLNKKAIRERVERALAAVQLNGLGERNATALSGGQQQRLALARALVMEPPLLLLDEPLSNLDAKLRVEMRFELKRVQAEFEITTLYVTHDQVEAMSMSDRIAVINEGRVEQVGTPREVYDRPASQFVAAFIGSANLIEGVVSRKESGGAYRVTTRSGDLRAQSTSQLSEGAKVKILVRPERVGIRAIDAADAETPTGWEGQIAAQAFLGEAVEQRVAVGDAMITVKTGAGGALPHGSSVRLHFPEDACVVLPDEE